MVTHKQFQELPNTILKENHTNIHETFKRFTNGFILISLLNQELSIESLFTACASSDPIGTSCIASGPPLAPTASGVGLGAARQALAVAACSQSPWHALEAPTPAAPVMGPSLSPDGNTYGACALSVCLPPIAKYLSTMWIYLSNVVPRPARSLCRCSARWNKA